MPTIVGEALVVVRVISDRLGADIKKAVKDSLRDAGPDIDKQAKAAGSRLSNSVADGVKDDMERVVGKEVVLATRRLAITAGRETDLLGRDLGSRFSAGIGNGIRDNNSIIGRELSASMVRAVNSDNSEFTRATELLGRQAIRSIGTGIENGGSDLRQSFDRTVQRQLTSGSGGALVRAADVDSNLFMRNFVQGLRNGEANVNDQLRRTFANTVRDQEADLTNGFRRVFVGGVRGAENDMRSEFRRVVDGSVGNGLRDAEPNLRTRIRGLGSRLNNALGNEFQRLGFHRFGNGWADDFQGAFNQVRSRASRVGEEAGNEVDRGLRRRLATNNRGLGGLFGKLGSDLGKEFNLGIGAARMGEAAISGLILIAPSIISGLGAVLTALAGEIINFAAALGPGIAASLGVAAVGVATLALNLGLLKLAFSGNTQQAKDFKAQLNTFKETLTSTFAPGVLSGFSDLIAKLKNDLLPAIGPLLKDTGTAMGDIARHIGEVVTSSDNLGRIKGILATNITFLGNFKDGLAGLTTSFLILFNAAKPVVDMIGNGIKNFGEWASKTLAAKEASGELGAFMDRLVQNFKDFWEFLNNIGTGIANVFRAASGPGRSLFESMSGIAERFVAWTSDTGNQSRMTTFFENARLISQQIFDLFGKIITAGGNAFTNVSTDKLQHFFDTLSSVGASIASVFSQIKTGAGANLAKIFDDIATVLDRAAASGSVVSFANAISTLALALADLVVTLTANPIGAQIAGIGLGFLLFGGIIKTLLGPLVSLGSALASALVPAEGLGAAVGALSVPFLVIAAAVAAVVGVFVAAYTQSQTLRDEISNLGSLVGGAFSTVWDNIGPKISVLVDKFLALAAAIGDRLAPVIAFIGPIIADAIRFIGEILGNIIDMLGGFIDIITGILTGNWQLIWQGVLEILSAAWEQIKTIFALGLSIISYAWDLITTVVYNAGQVLWGIITSVWTGIWSVITTVASAIWDFLVAGWNVLVDFVETLLNGWVTAVTAIFQTMWDAVVAIATGLWTALVAIWNFIYEQIIQRVIDIYNDLVHWFEVADEFVRGVWNGIPGFLGGIWDDVYDAVIQPVIDVYNDVVHWFGEVDTFVRGVWDGLVGIVAGIWNGVYDAIVQPVVDAYHAVTAWIHEIGTVISGVLTLVGGALTTVNDTLTQLFAAQTTAAGVAANPVGSGVAGGAAFGGTSILGPEGISGGIQRMLMEHLIPGLATGGIVSPVQGGSMFRLAEAGRPERVEPLDSSGLSNRDRAMIKSIVASTVSMMSGGGVNVDVRIGEHGLDQFVTQTIRREESNTARRIGKVRR